MKPLVVAAALSLALAAPAAADIVTVTYAGVVANGYDHHGLFGAVGALDGSAFKAVFTLNDAVGDSFYDPPHRSGFSFLNLGSSTLVGASIRIGDQSFQFWCGNGPDYCDTHHAVNDGEGGLDEVSTSMNIFAVDTTVVRLWDQFIGFDVGSANAFLPNYDYHSRFTYAFQPGDVASGELHISDRIEPFNAPGYDLQRVDATLLPTSVSVNVPEPGTWALMILGFGAVGAALRRRTLSAAAAARR